MKIEVTQEQIERGDKRLCASCPIALGATRALGKRVSVDLETMTVWTQGETEGFEVELPDEAQAFIYHFDNGAPVQPFTFEIPEL